MEPLETPWRRARRTQAQRQEASLANREGATAQPRSGGFWNRPRDVRWDGFLIEARTTEKGSYSISEKEFSDLTQQAILHPPGHLPAMQIEFSTMRLWVMRQEDFDAFQADLTNLARENKKLREKLAEGDSRGED